MKIVSVSMLIILAAFVLTTSAHAWFGTGKFKALEPDNGVVSIPVKDISDGKAHYFETKSEKGVMVKFFVVKSHDGIIRAAVDACDVCYRAGKGYIQEGNVMICENCSMRFATDRINEVKGGCNPAPLNRVVEGDSLKISMDEINANAWLCEFKK